MLLGDFKKNDIVNDTVWATIIGAVFLGTLLFLSRPFVTDDAYISFRYGYNLASGHGLTFNLGHSPVEGYSNFSFVILSAIFIKMGLDPVFMIRLICIISAIACIPVLHVFCRQMGVSRVPSFSISILFSLSSSFAYWAVSGMETAFYTLILTMGIFLFIQDTRKTNIAGTFLFVVASLTRPEAPVFWCVLAFLKICQRVKRGWCLKDILKHDCTWAVLFLSLYGGYFLLRFLYFGVLLPNPVYFKALPLLVDGRIEKHTTFGLMSLHFLVAWSPFHILVLLSLFSPSEKKVSLFLIVFVALVLFANTLVTIGYFDRFFLPLVPCLLVSSALGLNYIWATKRPLVVIISCCILVSLVFWQLFNPLVNPIEIAQRARRYKAGKTHIRKSIGEYLNEKYENNGCIVIGDIGLVGYVFKNTVYDLCGLTSYEYTLKYKKDMSKYADYLLSKNPDAIVICAIEEGNIIRARHEEDRVIMKNPSFITKYRATTFYRNPVMNYHYRIYERINDNSL